MLPSALVETSMSTVLGLPLGSVKKGMVSAPPMLLAASEPFAKVRSKAVSATSKPSPSVALSGLAASPSIHSRPLRPCAPNCRSSRLTACPEENWNPAVRPFESALMVSTPGPKAASAASCTTWRPRDSSSETGRSVDIRVYLPVADTGERLRQTSSRGVAAGGCRWSATAVDLAGEDPRPSGEQLR